MSNLSRLLASSARLKNRIAYLDKETELVTHKLRYLSNNIGALTSRYTRIKEKLDEGFTKRDIEEYLKGNQVDVTV